MRIRIRRLWNRKRLFENERQKVEVSVVKKDAETKTEVEGAVFGLYAKEDILVQDQVILEADTLIAKAVSDEKGTAVFQADLPFGSYYIRELEAPEGYVSSDEAVEVTAAYQGQEIPVVEVCSEFENEPTKISVKKTDLTTGVELDGAKLTVLDQDGTVVDSWTSVKRKGAYHRTPDCGRDVYTPGRICPLWVSSGRRSNLYPDLYCRTPVY